MNHERHTGFLAALPALALIVLGGNACTGPAAVAPPADGMVAASGLGVDEAWTKPGLDLAAYDKLLVAPTEFDFRDVPATASYRGNTGTTTAFPVREADRKQLADTVAKILREELAASRSFTLTDEPGPGVLVVRTSVQDIVSRVPPEIPGRSDVYLDRIGEATVVVNVDDSVSRETLVRTVDRRTAETLDGIDRFRRPTLANQSSSVTNWAEVRRETRRWASSLRANLDNLRARSP